MRTPSHVYDELRTRRRTRNVDALETYTIVLVCGLFVAYLIARVVLTAYGI